MKSSFNPYYAVIFTSTQNENIEEARGLEKKRISQELHDGILGRLFGTRLSLDSLNLNNSE